MFYANASIKILIESVFIFNLYKIYGILIKSVTICMKKSVLKFKIDKGIIALIQ